MDKLDKMNKIGRIVKNENGKKWTNCDKNDKIGKVI